MPKEAFDKRFTKRKLYDVGLQVLRCLDSEMPEKGVVHATSEVSKRVFQGIGDAKGEQGSRGSSCGGSCSYMVLSSKPKNVKICCMECHAAANTSTNTL